MGMSDPRGRDPSGLSQIRNELSNSQLETGSGDVGGRAGGRRSGGSGRGKSRGAGDAAGEWKRSARAAARPLPPHSPVEIIKLCSEFLNTDTDTTSTTLWWIMAKLVKNPSIQSNIHDKITAKTGDEKVEVSEENVHGMPYLRAVVLEGLRKHPPGHFVLPQKAMEDMEVGGYLIPKGATVNFMVAEISRDEQEWAKPMEFIPKRFLPDGDSEGVDVTGSKGICMMPFGVKRRICAVTQLASREEEGSVLIRKMIYIPDLCQQVACGQ
uniref:Cytochrome P450 n=1 Tax=Oryza nivara TaxID=4536 RepID=A0A0E0HTT8_ORYNI